MHLHPLLEEVLVPVCSPALLAGANRRWMRCRVFIGDRIPTRGKPAQAAGIVLTNSAVGARYDLRSMLIEAALAWVSRWCRVHRRGSSSRLVALRAGGQDGENFCLVLPNRSSWPTGRFGPSHLDAG